MIDGRKKVAFICVHNSCRSQIAEALGKHLASDVFESYSAGTETKPQINQDAVRIMKKLYGIDMETNGQYSKLITDIPDAVSYTHLCIFCLFIYKQLKYFYYALNILFRAFLMKTIDNRKKIKRNF